MINYYGALGITKNNSDCDIKERFSILSNYYKNSDYYSQEQKEKEISILNEANLFLSDSQKKTEFDAKFDDDPINELTIQYDDFFKFLFEKWNKKFSNNNDINLINETTTIKENLQKIAKNIEKINPEFNIYLFSNYYIDDIYKLGSISTIIGAELKEQALPHYVEIEVVKRLLIGIFLNKLLLTNKNEYDENKNVLRYSITEELIITLKDYSNYCQKKGMDIDWDSIPAETEIQINEQERTKGKIHGILNSTYGYCINCHQMKDVTQVVYYQNIGLLVTRLFKKIDGNLCPKCNEKIFWQYTSITWYFGWFGVISLFMTPIYVFRNISSYFSTLNFRFLSNEKLLLEGLFWKIVLLLVLLLFMWGLLSSNFN